MTRLLRFAQLNSEGGRRLNRCDDDRLTRETVQARGWSGSASGFNFYIRSSAPSPPSRGERDIVDFEHTTLGGKGFVPAVAGESFHLEAAETIRKIPIPRTETTVHRGCARMSSIAVVCSLHDSTLEAHGDDRAKEPATFSMQRER